MVRRKRRIAKPIAYCVVSAGVIIGAAAQISKPNWKDVALRFPILGGAFNVLDRDGYEADIGRQVTKDLSPFLVASIPVFPRGKTQIALADLATAQHIALLITSVIESQQNDVIPTEAIIIDANLEPGGSRLYFHGQNAGSRIEGDYDISKKTIDMKIYETILGRATARLTSPAGCQEQLFNGEKKTCAEYDVGCVIAAWIYSNDRCKRKK